MRSPNTRTHTQRLTAVRGYAVLEQSPQLRLLVQPIRVAPALETVMLVQVGMKEELTALKPKLMASKTETEQMQGVIDKEVRAEVCQKGRSEG